MVPTRSTTGLEITSRNEATAMDARRTIRRGQRDRFRVPARSIRIGAKPLLERTTETRLCD